MNQRTNSRVTSLPWLVAAGAAAVALVAVAGAAGVVLWVTAGTEAEPAPAVRPADPAQGPAILTEQTPPHVPRYVPPPKTDRTPRGLHLFDGVKAAVKDQFDKSYEQARRARLRNDFPPRVVEGIERARNSSADLSPEVVSELEEYGFATYLKVRFWWLVADHPNFREVLRREMASRESVVVTGDMSHAEEGATISWMIKFIKLIATHADWSSEELDQVLRLDDLGD